MSETEWLDIFSKNLKNIMHEVGITQRELAKESGLSEASISYYVQGTKIPSATNVVNLAFALDCSVNELIDFDDTIK